MELLRTGVSYKTASISFREKLRLAFEARTEKLESFVNAGLIQSGVILSTCARTELYFIPGPLLEEPAQPLQEICKQRAVELPRPSEQIYTSCGSDAVRQCFNVVSGLDSLILGESEILGQAKKAYQQANQAGYCDSTLHRLFQDSFRVAKKIQNLDASRPAGLGDTVAELARDELEQLENLGVLVLGAGTVGKLCLESLSRHGADNFFVLGHDRAKTRNQFDTDEMTVIESGQVTEVAEGIDLIVTASSSDSVLLDSDKLAEVQKRRDNRPLVVFDLAVPRDVDPAARELENLRVKNVDELRNTSRKKFIKTQFYRRAKRIIDSGVKKFNAWLKETEASPLFEQLQENFRQTSRAVLEEHVRQNDRTEVPKLELLSDRLADKLLNGPIKRLRNKLKADDGEAAARLLSELFDVDNPLDQNEAKRCDDSTGDNSVPDDG